MIAVISIHHYFKIIIDTALDFVIRCANKEAHILYHNENYFGIYIPIQLVSLVILHIKMLFTHGKQKSKVFILYYLKHVLRRDPQPEIDC